MKILDSANSYIGRLNIRTVLYISFTLASILFIVLGTFVEWREDVTLDGMFAKEDNLDKISFLCLDANSTMLKARINMGNFILTYKDFGYNEAKSRYITPILTYVSEIKNIMGNIRSLTSNQSIKGITYKIDMELDKYQSTIFNLTDKYMALGFSNSGTYGALQSSAREIESLLDMQKNFQLKSDLLMLRRNEKNYIIQNRDLYVTKHREDSDTFKKNIASAQLPSDIKSRLITLADSYAGFFQLYCQTSDEIRTINNNYVQSIRTIEPLLASLNEEAFNSVIASRQEREESGDTISLIRWGCGFLILLGTLIIAYIISTVISRDVKECKSFAEEISTGNLTNRLRLKGKNEFTSLAIALNKMAESLSSYATKMTSSTEQYRALVENSQDLIIRYDNNYICLYMNPVCSRLDSSVDLDYFIGEPIDSKIFLSKDIALSWKEMLQKVFNTCQTQEAYYDFETPGGTIYFHARFFPEYAEGGEMKGVVITARDITMQKLEEQKNKHKEQLLIQQSKMASMGEMIGLIAHQWRQPLNALALNVNDVKDAYTFGELDARYIEESVSASLQQIEFMSKTIDDFRNFFIPAKKKVHFYVNTAIEELLSMFLQIFNKSHIDIFIKAEQGTALLTDGYPNEFKQVLLNILNNSKDAIISKKRTDTQLQGKIEISIGNNEDNSEIIVSIKDNGGGIPDDVIGKIFDSYFSTKGSEGTGVGLYMSKTIIEEKMHGKISVSNIEDGAQFIIQLPVAT
ncbi:MAG: PAS domain-containing protein [Nitrospirae bacterium]|nr:PAS domain-containing protein [Nitrospirota bacterium]MBF0533792.1 PAS domain-containing protein [Nitrospirota bacterium]MBF0615499.1 PAS domain-containing protein [Nitrospirota bacterium]